MSHYAELHVNYNGHTDTYYSRKFLVMDEVPIAGEGNVIDVFPHVMNFEGRPGVKFNSYLVRTFDEEAYNEALEKVTLWGISGDVVDKRVLPRIIRCDRKGSRRTGILRTIWKPLSSSWMNLPSWITRNSNE